MHKYWLLPLVFIGLVGGCSSTASLQKTQQNTTVFVIGSSVAAGWVSSYEEKHDFRNGWAFKMARELKSQGITVYTASQPGATTSDVLGRIETDVLEHQHDFVIIALSLSNEGISRDSTDTTYNQFLSNLEKMITLCRQKGCRPIIASCYACNEYSEREYQLTQKMNLQLSQLGVPMINLLGALNDEHGHFPQSYWYDESHPNNKGHEEMFAAVNPQLFKAEYYSQLVEQNMKTQSDFLTIKNPDGQDAISFVPQQLFHSFTIHGEFRLRSSGDLIKLVSTQGESQLSYQEGQWVYHNQVDEPSFSENTTLSKEWHSVSLSYNNPLQKISLFVDGQRILESQDKMDLVQVVWAPHFAQLDCRNLAVYRSALTPLEMEYVHAGSIYAASLELFAPLSETPRLHSMIRNNTNQNLYYYPTQVNLDIIRTHYETRTQKLATEPLFAEIPIANINSSTVEKFVGRYEIDENDFATFFIQDGRYFLEDSQQKSEIFPKSGNRFFIKHPQVDIELVFEDKDDCKQFQMMVNGNVTLTGQMKNE